MKLKSTLVLVFSLVYLGLNGQILNNGNFNSFTCPNTGDAFSMGCVPSWNNSHGTPSITTVNATTRTAWMWSYGGRGEGILANYGFDGDCDYNITFRIRTDDRNTGDPNVRNFARVNVVAATGLGSSTFTTIPTPATQQNIYTNTMGPFLNNWVTVNTTFNPNANYSQLWIYPRMTQPSDGLSQAEMQIDDITITPRTYSTGFYVSTTSSNGGNVTATVTAYTPSSPGVAHWWDIYYGGSNGQTTGNTEVPGNSTVCCSASSTTFSNNLVIDQWYYVKHGVWTDCMTWRETRRAFIVRVNKNLQGEPTYYIEYKDDDNNFQPSDAYLFEMDNEVRNMGDQEMETEEEFSYGKLDQDEQSFSEGINIYPNPIEAGRSITVELNGQAIAKAELFDITGKPTGVGIGASDAPTVQLKLNDVAPGVYFIRILKNDNSVVMEKLVVQ